MYSLLYEPRDHIENAQCRDLLRKAGLPADRQQPAMQCRAVGPQRLPDRVQTCPVRCPGPDSPPKPKIGYSRGRVRAINFVTFVSRSPAAPTGPFPGPRQATPGRAVPVRRTRSRSGPIAARRAFSASSSIQDRAGGGTKFPAPYGNVSPAQGNFALVESTLVLRLSPSMEVAAGCQASSLRPRWRRLEDPVRPDSVWQHVAHFHPKPRLQRFPAANVQSATEGPEESSADDALRPRFARSTTALALYSFAPSLLDLHP